MTGPETALAFALLGGALAAAGLLAVQRYLRARFARVEELAADAARERAYGLHLLERIGAEQLDATIRNGKAIAEQRSLEFARADEQRIRAEAGQRARIRRFRAARARGGRR